MNSYKMNTGLLSIIGLILVIFIVLMMGNSSLAGYSSSKTLSEYPYEGFEAIQNAFEKRYGEAFVPSSDKKHYAEAFEASSDKKKYAEAFESSSSEVKVFGFSGLQNNAYGNENAIGFMYNNESNKNCQPFGYTTSTGNVCLSDADKKLLTTRGGNALGSPDQIGN
jgi:hypothetical protein